MQAMAESQRQRHQRSDARRPLCGSDALPFAVERYVEAIRSSGIESESSTRTFEAAAAHCRAGRAAAEPPRAGSAAAETPPPASPRASVSFCLAGRNASGLAYRRAVQDTAARGRAPNDRLPGCRPMRGPLSRIGSMR